MIYRFEQTTSTNDDAKDLRYKEGDVVWASFQTAGRGQRGHVWESRRGENLTFSVVLEPDFLPSSEQFLISQVVALALVDMLSSYGIDARIKWTNDIYVGDRKIVGILIEHTSVGSTVHRTVVGVGVNVNQEDFDPSLPNPVSMKQLGGEDYDLGEVLNRFLACLTDNYELLREGMKDDIALRYRTLMYDLDAKRKFSLPDGSVFTGTIRGVRATGELIVENEDGCEKTYLFKEIEFVLKK